MPSRRSACPTCRSVARSYFLVREVSHELLRVPHAVQFVARIRRGISRRANVTCERTTLKQRARVARVRISGILLSLHSFDEARTRRGETSNHRFYFSLDVRFDGEISRSRTFFRNVCLGKAAQRRQKISETQFRGAKISILGRLHRDDYVSVALRQKHR